MQYFTSVFLNQKIVQEFKYKSSVKYCNCCKILNLKYLTKVCPPKSKDYPNFYEN